jgi:leader peptidase (prepilin peptidase)/N-methyltransferase
VSGVGVAGCLVAGCLVAVAAGVLAPWARRVAGVDSGWLRPSALVAVGFVLGGGAALIATGPVELATYLVLALACALLVGIDLATHRLPDVVVGPTALLLLVGLTVAAATGGGWGRLADAILAGVAVAAAYLVLVLVAPAGIGLGDLKLAGVLGAFLGWQGWSQVVVATLAAFVLNGVVVAVLLLSRRVSRGGEVAFGPWLVVGAAVASGLAWLGLGLGGSVP